MKRLLATTLVAMSLFAANPAVTIAQDAQSAPAATSAPNTGSDVNNATTSRGFDMDWGWLGLLGLIGLAGLRGRKSADYSTARTSTTTAR